MKKLLILIVLTLISSANLLAYKYAFDSIPEPLRRNANAVIRTNQMVFKMNDPGSADITFRYAITIMNEKADYLRHVGINYDSYNKIEYIKAAAYDNNGKLIEVVPKTKIIDVVNNDEFLSDDRTKIVLFSVQRYPYTIEVEYKLSNNSLLNPPSWNFQTSDDCSVELSGAQFIIPKDVKFRFRELYLTNHVDSTFTGDYKIYTWVENNIPAVKKGFFTPVIMVRQPKVMTAVNNFKFGGYEGNMESWKSFGQWSWKLNEGLDGLSEEEVLHVKSLVSGIADEREKVKILYKYMQSRTRYVSIQLGIGGYRSFPAEVVSKRGYGDCKGLSNYMLAILKAAGIKSYYTLVAAGANENIVDDFVCNQFDHIILCVPLPQDTVWLECTNQTKPFNFLGSFTADRSVLLVTPDGGIIAKTPAVKNNCVKTVGSVVLKKYNESTAEITTASYGTYYEESLAVMGESEDEIRQNLNASLSMGTFTIPTVKFTDYNEETPYSELTYTVKMKGFAIAGNSRLHFYPCINKIRFSPSDSSDIRVFETETMMDSIKYIIPEGYEYENIPEDIKIETKAGRFVRTMTVTDDGNVIYARYFTLKKGWYYEEDAMELYGLVRKVAKADHQKVILKIKALS